jgi:hypothetical protein
MDRRKLTMVEIDPPELHNRPRPLHRAWRLAKFRADKWIQLFRRKLQLVGLAGIAAPDHSDCIQQCRTRSGKTRPLGLSCPRMPVTTRAHLLLRKKFPQIVVSERHLYPHRIDVMDEVQAKKGCGTCRSECLHQSSSSIPDRGQPRPQN